MPTFTQIVTRGLIFAALVLFIFMAFSCQEEQKASPTAPAPLDGLKSIARIGSGNAETYKAYIGDGFFQLNIPLPGDYRINYNATTSSAADFSFRVMERSLLQGELQPGSRLQEMSLQKGSLTGEAFQRLPGIEIFKSTQFQADNNFGTRLLMTGGIPFSPTPIPTPTPRPTPRPTATPVVAVTPHSGTDRGMVVIVAAGDSITAGVGSGSGGYPAALERKLRAAGYNISVRNAGIPGAQADGLDAQFAGMVSGAQIALIMIGTNDVINAIRCPAPAYCNAAAHLRSMVNAAKNAGATPLVGTIPPIKTLSAYSWANPHVRALNAQIASGVGAIVVDNYAAILSGGGDALFSDAVHLNDWGYEALADSWLNALTGNHLIH